MTFLTAAFFWSWGSNGFVFIALTLLATVMSEVPADDLRNFMLFGFEVPLCPDMRCSLDRCRRGQFEVNARCQCDPSCVLFGDCCYDYESTCKDNPRTLALQLPSGSISGRINATCTEIPDSWDDGTFWIVDQCPLDYLGNLGAKCDFKLAEKDKNSDEFLYNVPVAVHNITYKNVYCALCHHNDVLPESASFWALGFKCSGRISSSHLVPTSNVQYLSSVLPNCEWAVFPSEVSSSGRADHLRPCVKTFGSNYRKSLSPNATFAPAHASCNPTLSDNLSGLDRDAGIAGDGHITQMRDVVDRVGGRDVNLREGKFDLENNSGTAIKARANVAENVPRAVLEALVYACHYYQYNVAAVNGEENTFKSSISFSSPSSPQKTGIVDDIKGGGAEADVKHGRQKQTSRDSFPFSLQQSHFREQNDFSDNTSEGQKSPHQGTRGEQSSDITHNYYSETTGDSTTSSSNPNAFSPQGFKNHHCALCSGVDASDLRCDSYQRNLQVKAPTLTADNVLRQFDLIVKLRNNGVPTELFFTRGNSAFSAGKICPTSSVLSVFSASCKHFQCPAGFHFISNYCIPDFRNFSCDHSLLYATPSQFQLHKNHSLQIQNKQGKKFLVTAGKVAKDGDNLVVCANDTFWEMFTGSTGTGMPVVLDALFIVSGICATAFLTTGMALILITVRKNSFTLIAFNILLTLFFENLAMFPRIFTNEGGYVCIISAIIDHYCWVVLFSWLCALAYEEMHSQNLNMFQLYSRPQTWLYMILCWLSPVILVMINTVMHFLQFDWLVRIYGGQSCSVSNVAIFLFSSVLPTAILITLAVFFLIIALYKHKPPSPNWSVETAEFHRRWLYASLIFLFLTGMTWCLHLLYNIVQLAHAYYACSFALHIQSSVFGIITGYFMRLERIVEQEHQRRWRDALSKRMVAYHSNNNNTININNSLNKNNNVTENQSRTMSRTPHSLTPTLRPKVNLGTLGHLNSSTLRAPHKPMRSLSDNGNCAVHTSRNPFPAVLPNHMNRFSTIQNPRSFAGLTSGLITPDMNRCNFSLTQPIFRHPETHQRESPSDVTSEHNGNNSDSEENNFMTSPVIDNLSGGSGSTSSHSSTYKRIVFNHLEQMPTPSENAHGSSETSNECSGSNEEVKRATKEVASQVEERKSRGLSEDFNLVVDLDDQASPCNRASEI